MNDESVKSIRARQALYGLLARLFLGPPDAALLSELRALPGFAEAIGASADALAVDYERVFGRSVYPYESLYVDQELMLNTAAAERLSDLYAQAGYLPDPRAAGAPDHLGLELDFMAYLLGQGEGELAGRLLGAHLAVWAPSCLRAVRRSEPHPLHLAAAELAEELILSDLSGEQGAGAGRQAPIALVPQEPDDEAGLNRVVRRLITPAEVGIFLGRADIAALGRRLQLPAPIGERFMMLRGLFETAGQFEAVPALLAALDGLLEGEQAGLGDLAARHPAWAAYARPWQDRLAAGRAMIAEMRAQVDDL